MKLDKASFLGRGWSFPSEFDHDDHDVKMVEKELDIKESLFILLSTAPGERIMHPTYGCGLNKFVFEPYSVTLQKKIKTIIERAILMYEPRIKLVDIEVEQVSPNDGIVYITIDYYIKQINSRQNMVYPMYFIEGTNLHSIK